MPCFFCRKKTFNIRTCPALTPKNRLITKVCQTNPYSKGVFSVVIILREMRFFTDSSIE